MSAQGCARSNDHDPARVCKNSTIQAKRRTGDVERCHHARSDRRHRDGARDLEGRGPRPGDGAAHKARHLERPHPPLPAARCESFFSEIGGLVAAEDGNSAAVPPARTLSPADGVVIGTGLIDGRPVVVFSQDFAVFGGSIGRLGSAKVQRALQLAITRGLPLVMVLDGGGHRIQDGQDARHFANANATFHNFARASGWVPMVALMLGAGFAGPTNYAGMADLVVMVRGVSTMGIAGPALVKAATGEDVEAQALGGAEVQVDRQGSPISASPARTRRSTRPGASCRTCRPTPARRQRCATIRRSAGSTMPFSTSYRFRRARPTTYARCCAWWPTPTATSRSEARPSPPTW